MAKLTPDQLANALKRGLAPVYLVSGDENLLVQEACDAIRQAARSAGFSDRELHHTDSGFDWAQWSMDSRSMNLFAERKLVEVRLHNTKPGESGTAALRTYCTTPDPDTVLLLVAPKLDRNAQKSAWFKAVDAAGQHVAVWPIGSRQWPRWLAQRLQRAGLTADRKALQILAERVEGNLLAAVQEIEKLKLLTDHNTISASMMASAVADSARYDLFSLVDKALAGDARATATTLNGLRNEGVEATLVLWALQREIRTLSVMRHALGHGQALERVARQQGVFDFRMPLVRGALQRLQAEQLREMSRLCAYIDRCIKGMAPENPWSGLLELGLCLAGSPSQISSRLDVG